jgi:hypothetical protein
MRNSMKSKKITVKGLAKLIERGLDEGVNLVFYQPEDKPPPTTWDQVIEAAHLAYSTALNDVLMALEGEEEPLREAFSDEGRMAFVDPEDLEQFMDLVERMDRYDDELKPSD